MGVWLWYKIMHITHGKVHPYQPLYEAKPGRCRGTCSKETKMWIHENTKTKINFYLPDIPRRLRRSLLKGNSWRRSSSLLPRAEVQSESWTQDEKIRTGFETRVIGTKSFCRGNLGKLRPYLSLLHDGQSTDDSLIRKDEGEEMKPRSRHSKADGSTDCYQ